MVDSSKRSAGSDELAGCLFPQMQQQLHKSQPSGRSIKTSFIGVFALSKPSKTRLFKSQHSNGTAISSRSSHHVDNGRPENTTAVSNHKRKRTPSDGSNSQSSGVSGLACTTNLSASDGLYLQDSFNPHSLVASTEHSPAVAHLRLHDSLKRVSQVSNGSSIRTSSQASSSRHTSQANSSQEVAFDTQRISAVSSSLQAEPVPSPHPSADRKGKGRQLSIPLVEIHDKHPHRSHRAASSVPTSRSDRVRRNAASEDSDRLQRAQSAKPLYTHTVVEEDLRDPSRRANDILDSFVRYPSRPPEVLTIPDVDSPMQSLPDISARAARPVPQCESVEHDATMTLSASIPSSESPPPLLATSGIEEVPSKAAATDDPIETQSSQSSSSLSTLLFPNENWQGPTEPPPLREELVCISSSENEDEQLLEETGEMQIDKCESRLAHRSTLKSASGGVIEETGSASKKSVKFAAGEKEERQGPSRVKRRTSLMHTKPQRAVHEYFVGEGEDYSPSDSTDQHSDEVETVPYPSSGLASAFGSSPLTPLTSSNLRPAAAVEPELVDFLQTLSRSPRSARSNRSNKSTSQSSSKKPIDYVDSDEDGEVPLRRLQARNRSREQETARPRKKVSTSARVRPCNKTVNAPLAAANESSAVTTTSRPLFTRSRATGESAECRQCHRCETYQSKSKTLRCMTCEQAVCTTCMATHYAGHPSYAATLVFMRVDPVTNAAAHDVDVSEIDFRCPVCKYLCRCPVCLRGPFPKASTVPAVPIARVVSPEKSEPMQRSESLLSSDADLEPLHWPGLVRGTSTRPNLKVRLRLGRAGAPSRLSKSAQQHTRAPSATNAYYDLQDAIAGEAARRAQVDAETDFVPVVASRQPRKDLPSSPSQQNGSTTQTASSDSEDMVVVTSSRRPRPALSARVRLATKVGQQLGKSPAFVESRRSPRREGDQLM